MSQAQKPSSPLRRNSNFAHLWWAESISQLGSQVSLLALPLVAITVLHASTFAVGALTAVEFAPFVLFGLPAGAIVDHGPAFNASQELFVNNRYDSTASDVYNSLQPQSKFQFRFAVGTTF